MTVAVSNVDSFVNNSDAKTAVAAGIANFTGVPPVYVDVDLAVEIERRRLRAQQPHQSDDVILTYAIAVGGDAPESVATTGAEVVAKLKAENSGSIADAISSSMQESLGRSFVLSVKKVNIPKVLMKDPESPSTMQAGATRSTSAMPTLHFSSGRRSISYFSGVTLIVVCLLMF